MKITGALSAILDGLPRDEKILKSILGLPIKDTDGTIIGTVHDIDLEKDIWIGSMAEIVAKPKFENGKVYMSLELDRGVFY